MSFFLMIDSVHRIHSILDGLDKETNNMDIEQLLSVINGKQKKRRDDPDDAKDHHHHHNSSSFFHCSSPHSGHHNNSVLQGSREYLDEIKNALVSGNDECPICLDFIENVSITRCGHRFCTECLRDLLEEREQQLRRKRKATTNTQFTFECPVCRNKLKRKEITKVVNEEKHNEELEGKRKFKQQRNKQLKKQSAKIQKLMDVLEEIHETEPDAKVIKYFYNFTSFCLLCECIVFSQWTSMLDIIEEELENEDYGYCRLDGTMSSTNRSKSIHRLNHDDLCWVMLISLKAGGVGLNLVAANHVFMMDIWWNPAIEDQALDRVHRIGQTKPVTIHRIEVEDTVEQKVRKLQDKKRRIAEKALDMKGGSRNRKKESVNLSSRDLIELFGGGSGGRTYANLSSSGVGGYRF